jgi:glycine/D-amino acid oxidase-like deaminating enzyme
MNAPLPSHAEVVVVGAGVLGSATAFHLAGMGRNVVQFERGPLASEASSQGAGFLCSYRPRRSSAQILDYSTRFYHRFHEETGFDVDLHRVGAVRVALGERWLAELRAEAETGRAIGVEIHELSPREVADRVPGIDVHDARGGFWAPGEGYVTATRDAAIGLARAAARRGALVRTYDEVASVAPLAGGGFEVTAESGRIRAETVVLATNAGLWPLLRRLGMRLAAYPIHHQLAVYDIPAGVDASLPTVRIVERDLYLRHEAGGLLVGGVGADPTSPAVTAPDAAFDLAAVEVDRPRLEEARGRAAEFIPAIAGAVCIREQRGLLVVAPDLEPMLGEILPRLFVATADLRGIQSGPGLGLMLAQLITSGESEWDARPYRPDRLADLAGHPERVREAAINGIRSSFGSTVTAPG